MYNSLAKALYLCTACLLTMMIYYLFTTESVAFSLVQWIFPYSYFIWHLEKKKRGMIILKSKPPV